MMAVVRGWGRAEDAITEHRGRQVQEAHSLLREKWCLNWGLQEQSSWLSHRDSIPRRESICPAPELRWQPPHFGSRRVCPCAHGHTHVWVWVKYYVRSWWVNGYKKRKEGWESRNSCAFAERTTTWWHSLSRNTERRRFDIENCGLCFESVEFAGQWACVWRLSDKYTVWSSEKDHSSRSGPQSFQHMDDIHSQGSR